MKVLRNTKDNSVNPYNPILAKESHMQELEVEREVVAVTGFLDEAGRPVTKAGVPIEPPTPPKPAKRQPRAKKAAKAVVSEERLDEIAADVAVTASALNVALGGEEETDPLAVLRGNSDGLGQ